MQLLIDPLRKAHLFDALDVAGPQSIAQPVERVQNGLLLGEIGDRQAGENGIFLGAGRRKCGARAGVVVFRCEVILRGEKDRRCERESGQKGECERSGQKLRARCGPSAAAKSSSGHRLPPRGAGRPHTTSRVLAPHPY
jgi:hypothetical protein